VKDDRAEDLVRPTSPALEILAVQHLGIDPTTGFVKNRGTQPNTG
jgi:hypothetical protein